MHLEVLCAVICKLLQESPGYPINYSKLYNELFLYRVYGQLILDL